MMFTITYTPTGNILAYALAIAVFSLSSGYFTIWILYLLLLSDPSKLDQNILGWNIICCKKYININSILIIRLRIQN